MDGRGQSATTLSVKQVYYEKKITMKEKLEQIFDKHHYGYSEYNKDEIIKELLVLYNFTGEIEQFYCGFENDDYNKKCAKQCDECSFIESL